MKKHLRTILKSAISISLVAVIIINVFSPVLALSAGTGLGYSNQLGTNYALGSPLLSENFDPENFNKWEIIAFGVFLSNFTVPLVDNYASAFSKTAGGTEGRGREALQFASGNDSAAMQSLQSLLNYIIPLQTKMKPIEVSYKTVTFGETITGAVSGGMSSSSQYGLDGTMTETISSKRDANILDLLPLLKGQSYNNGALVPNILAAIKGTDTNSLADQGTIGDTDLTDTDLVGDLTGGTPGTGAATPTTTIPNIPYMIKSSSGFTVYDTTGGNNKEQFNQLVLASRIDMPKLTIKGNGTAGSDVTVFDLSDGWDVQILSAWVTSAILNSEYKDAIQTNLEGMINSRAPLCLDNFGNICVYYEGKYIIIIPAAANQHLTKEPAYNLVNSLILNGSYTGSQSSTIMKHVLGAAGAGGPLSIGKEDANGTTPCSGETLVSYSLEVYKYQKLLKAIKAYSGTDKSETFQAFASNWLSSSANFNAGDAANQLMHADPLQLNTSEVGLKISVLGGADQNGWVSWNDTFWETFSTCSTWYSSVVSNIYPAKTDVPTLSWIHTDFAEKDSIFGDHSYAALLPFADDSKMFNNYLANYAFKYMDGSAASMQGLSVEAPSAYRTKIKSLADMQSLGNFVWAANEAATDDSVISPFVVMAAFSQKQLPLKNGVSILGASSKTIKQFHDRQVIDDFWTGDPTSATVRKNAVNRLMKFYTRKKTMTDAEKVLNVTPGTEFSVWTPWIYVTYLEWYGITKGDSKFNEEIFSTSSDVFAVEPEEMFAGLYLTAEEKEEEIRNYTYLMLNPTAGREYRSNILLNWFSDFIYNSYISIVYGNSVNTYSGNIGTAGGAGFLKFNSYEENWLTSWFIDRYVEYAVLIIGVVAILILIVGVIMRKKIGWFLMSIILLVNIVLLTPNIGNLAPTLANSSVQKIFESNMTYWSMAETISNLNIEQEYLKSNSGTSSAEAQALATYTSMLSTVYLDRTLMLKNDISKKVVPSSTGILNEIQGLETTRWLLPRLMRQFTASDSSKDYVYQTLGDTYDNWTNMYWAYVPSDRNSVRSLGAAASADSPSYGISDIAVKSAAFTTYTDTSDNALGQDSTFGSWFQTSNGIYKLLRPGMNATATQAETWNSLVRMKDDSQLPHTSFYMLSKPGTNSANAGGATPRDLLEVAGPSRKSSGTGETGEYDWVSYANTWKAASSTVVTEWNNLLTELQKQASDYNSGDGTPENFGFLWTTENPGAYFYQVVKETFMGDSQSLSQIVSLLQGNYKISSHTGINSRVDTAMHFQDTGDARDILDLQELFTNVIPYMYSVQVIAGGDDGTNGVYSNNKLDKYGVYDENYASWLFRSNWVTKIVDSNLMATSGRVRDANGQTIAISNMIDPGCYPDNRPMVFSEAQQKAMGLLDGDLNLVELKMVKVNKEVERKWTLLLNYVNTPGITSEVLCRQMTLDALTVFNKEFSVDGMLNASLKLYPTSVDLRSLSFDSVMKLLMINSTRNSEYVYGDTMKTVIENSDILSALLMLLGAFTCASVIPLLRDTVLGLMFYLGIWSVLCNIFSGGKAKLKTMAAYTINHVAYLLLTLAFYGVFGLLINVTTVDEVLSIGNIAVTAGPPTWQFLIILVAAVVYGILSFKIMGFVFKNYRDLGFEVYATWSQVVAGKITSGFHKAANAIRGNNDGASTAAAAAGGAAGAAAGAVAVKVIDELDDDTSDGSTRKRKKKTGADDVGIEQEAGDSGYILDKVPDASGDPSQNTINQEIKRGAEMPDKSGKATGDTTQGGEK